MSYLNSPRQWWKTTYFFLNFELQTTSNKNKKWKTTSTKKNGRRPNKKSNLFLIHLKFRGKPFLGLAQLSKICFVFSLMHAKFWCQVMPGKHGRKTHKGMDFYINYICSLKWSLFNCQETLPEKNWSSGNFIIQHS